MCGGTGVAVDVRGDCCPAPLPPSGLCCSAVDSCGVCGGVNACGATVSVEVANASSLSLVVGMVAAGDATPLSTVLGVARACVTGVRLGNTTLVARALGEVDAAGGGWDSSMLEASAVHPDGSLLAGGRALSAGTQVNSVQSCTRYSSGVSH